MNQKLSVFAILLVVVIGTLGARVEAQKGLAESAASAKKVASTPSPTKKPAAVNGLLPKGFGSSGSSRARAAGNPTAAGTKPEQPSLKIGQNNKPAAAAAAAATTEKPKPTVKAAGSRNAPSPPATKKPAGDAAKKSPEPVKKATEAPKKSTDTAQKARAH